MQFTLPAHVSLLRFHAARASILARWTRQSWLSEQEKLWAQVQFVSEAEIESRLLHARAAKTAAVARAARARVRPCDRVEQRA